ncbi:MAG: TldD/PmbA family protein [Theionarchaea archaeon]|nr:TldD/PmbA family protein [Theionarchaea archaeon]MBU7020428.1 TldD/PmbA family protein [Theionarchaea archaeon]MBU7034793.1 TldD/PmbA family protein [Theionarchaea archaeon]MBU7040869.1 TldD/PmbA family protein [Theionarchaea archaeon]
MDALERVVDTSPANYTEARFHQRKKNQITIRKGEFEDITSELYSGVGIRVLHLGAWGFSSVNSTEGKALHDALCVAVEMAEAASRKKNQQTYLKEAVPVTGTFEARVQDSVLDHSLEEKIDLCKSTDTAVLSHEKIKSSFIHYQELVDSKEVITSHGSHALVTDSKVQFYVGAVAGTGSNLVSYTDAVGNTGGWEIIIERSPELMVDKAVNTAKELMNAHYPKGGKTTVILDHGLVGLLCHEAVGHTMEADFALSGAVTKDLVGEKVASELVTMIDSGQTHAGGWTPVDDEGVECRDVVLIDHGFLRNFMHNRETAYLMDTEPTGNARAWEYDFEPLIRMRNTYIQKGDWKEEEILQDTKTGYMLKGAGSGQADSNGEFMFQVKEAYTIDGGEEKELLRSVSMTGNAFDVLGTVDAAGSRVVFDMGFGACGKQQLAKVDGGGPLLRCQVLVGGR